MGHWLHFSAYKASPSCAPSNRASPDTVPDQWCSVGLATLLLVLCHYGIYVVSNVLSFLCELRHIGISKVLWTYKTFWWKTAARQSYRTQGSKFMRQCRLWHCPCLGIYPCTDKCKELSCNFWSCSVFFQEEPIEQVQTVI